ncbi:MAG: ArsR/SmtB family transcription factor [Sphingomicrobium sp.]
MLRTKSSGGPSPEHLFAALGEPTRLRIIDSLSRGGSRSIASLAADSSVTRQALTKHLRVLEHVGLVIPRKVGRESRFALQGERLAEASSYLTSIARQWEDALGRLKAHIEQG